MRVAIGSDHAGYELKLLLVKFLQQQKIEVHDMGTFSKNSVDYPDYAGQVCHAIKRDISDFGILICYTGIGMSIAANKYKGIRAALVSNTSNARLCREHNDANILCLGAKDVDFELAKEIVDIFLKTPFSEGRHSLRVQKVMNIEKNEKR